MTGNEPDITIEFVQLFSVVSKLQTIKYNQERYTQFATNHNTGDFRRWLFSHLQKKISIAWNFHIEKQGLGAKVSDMYDEEKKTLVVENSS